MRSDAPRTAYRVYSSPDQPPLGAHSVCFVPPRTQAHAVTRDSRNRARRKRKVRSPHQREEDRYNLYLKLGDYRSASRTPDTFTRGPSPSNTTNNHFQLGFMNQDADPVSSSTYWTPGPCTGSSAVIYSSYSTEDDTVNETSSSSTSPGPSPSSSSTSPGPSPPSSPTPIDITNAIGRIDDTLDARVRDEPYEFDASDEVSALTEARQETASNMIPSVPSPWSPTSTGTSPSSSWTSMSPGWSPTLPPTSEGENTHFSALISQNQLQPPVGMPDYTACIVAGENGLKICDPLQFLPTSAIRFKNYQPLVRPANPSVAAAVDQQQPGAGTKAQLDLHGVSSVPPVQHRAPLYTPVQHRAPLHTPVPHSAPLHTPVQPSAPLHTPVQHSAPLHTTV